MNEASFGWDPHKAALNLEKHGVTFEEATSVFADPMFISVVDDEHSADEERYITIGLSAQGRLLMIAHTDRDGQIRIISVRRATKAEEQFYVETK